MQRRADGGTRPGTGYVRESLGLWQDPLPVEFEAFAYCMLQSRIAVLALSAFVSRLKIPAMHAWRRVRPVIRFQLAYRTVPLIGLWVLLVLYPNPFNILVSVHRVFYPDIDPVIVQPLLEGLPSDPAGIEREILLRIPYKYDWETHGMPWYFPRTASIVGRGEGDCKARAVVLASVFERLEIPYRFNSSFVHVWVEYEDKAETTFENPRAAFYQQDPETGRRFFQFPEIEWKLWFDSTVEGLWTVMPMVRKVLLVLGIALIVAARVVLRRNTSKSIDNAMAT